MKNIVRILLLAAIGSTLNASAQTATTPKECYRRCTTLPFEDPEATEDSFKEKLMKIQAKKKEETDPVKIKELDEAEKNEIERMKRSLTKICSKICKFED
ncbi:hypothetical protein H8L32_04580 [Undibacterium sp. CY18W]|uniref:PsiF repeat-containing protein n=1 Tax=Undibacterium hunanense TaxID=2762292 RepID=A0ABR6ZLG6_9BURK|nr:hypothetical protein [Undibacterium hunanense]MBC3916741.1 hypothetical protein [Undibacterium hunanense]